MAAASLAENGRVAAPRVLVVGAGIAGLALAVALRSRGLSPTLIERSPGVISEGAGLYLVGAATRVLRSLGLESSVLEHARVIRTQRLFDSRGAELARTNVEAFWAACGPCLGVPRAALHALLLERAGAADVRFGVGLRALHESGSALLAELSDGTRDVFDLVVGADGVHSTVRGLVSAGVVARFREQMSWRFIAPLPDGIDGWTVFMGPRRAFLFVPVGEREAYCYADQVVAQPERAAGGHPARLRELFGGFPRPVRDTLEALGEDHPIHYAPIEEVRAPLIERGRVVLIGDAAHAMSPNMACGAGMGLEDAVVLAELVAGGCTLDEVAGRFARRRSSRIEWIRAQTDRRDGMRGLPSLVRNLSLWMFWNRIYAANYRPLLSPP